ncbi:MAG: tRNA adenosine(34) deaminase TadA [Deltaproteobacteria bacterium]|nr:tRNA adenosine(34) deaminase TadA [Deltaproteobacteria bacterium]
MFFKGLVYYARYIWRKWGEEEKRRSLYVGKKTEHKDFMAIALKQAKKAENLSEVPIGAVLVDNKGKIISKGYNFCLHLFDPTAHAEIIAIREAGEELFNYRLGDTTLYVTIEPCIMCMAAAVNARIKRIVYGAADYKAGAAGSVYSLHEDPNLNHRIEIIGGVMQEECRELMLGFFRKRR